MSSYGVFSSAEYQWLYHTLSEVVKQKRGLRFARALDKPFDMVEVES